LQVFACESATAQGARGGSASEPGEVSRSVVLRIGAWDAAPEPPEPPVPLEQVAEVEEGRGLGLVRACADLWGWQPLARDGSRGKVVWCELAAV